MAEGQFPAACCEKSG